MELSLEIQAYACNAGSAKVDVSKTFQQESEEPPHLKSCLYRLQVWALKSGAKCCTDSMSGNRLFGRLGFPFRGILSVRL